jgi:hypothetical protein
MEIDIPDLVAIEGSLHDYLVENRDEIQFVALKWTWSPTCVCVETDYVADGGEEDGHPVFATFHGQRIDKDFTFYGPIDQAIEYAEEHGQWDGFDSFELEAGVLHAEHDEFDDLACEYPATGEFLAEHKDYDFIFNCLATANEEGIVGIYFGPVRRRDVGFRGEGHAVKIDMDICE